jgi:hypothetical protein
MVLPRRAHSGRLGSLTGKHHRNAHVETSGGGTGLRPRLALHGYIAS